MNENPLPTAVIGAGGFIGSRLTDALSTAAIPVERIVRETPFLRDGRLIPGLRAAEVIFYLATSINPAVAERYPERVAADHRLFAELIEALRDAGHRPLLVLTSTAGAIYAPACPPPYAEDDPVGPTSAYGIAKLALERTLFDALDAVRPIVLRIANAYGPGQHTGTGQGVIGHWIRAAEDGSRLLVYGDLSVRRDYVYISDVVDALVCTYRQFGCEDPGASMVLNVASGHAVSLGQLLQTFQQVIGRELPVGLSSPRMFDRGDNWFDPGRASTVLGWKARIPLAEGLRMTWEERSLTARRT